MLQRVKHSQFNVNPSYALYYCWDGNEHKTTLVWAKDGQVRDKVISKKIMSKILRAALSRDDTVQYCYNENHETYIGYPFPPSTARLLHFRVWRTHNAD